MFVFIFILYLSASAFTFTSGLFVISVQWLSCEDIYCIVLSVTVFNYNYGLNYYLFYYLIAYLYFLALFMILNFTFCKSVVFYTRFIYDNF
jgi:hypothetical protein